MGVRLLHRLAGLETEYVARFRPDSPSAKRPLTFHLLHSLVAELQRRLPLVPADYPKKGFFLATGGAVWQERPGEGIDHPLIEGSTPECRGARQLHACQRAQDRLFSAAARDVAGGDFTLCKSDCDADGNVYGTQENYEVTLARGGRLRAWKLGVCWILLPLTALGWLGLVPIAMGLVTYYITAIPVYLLYLLLFVVSPLRLIARLPSEREIREELFGPWGGELFRFMPRWVGWTATVFEHIVLGPAALALAALGSLTAFREIRHGLLPFLISRSILCGTGRLDSDGGFHIASKASGIKLVSGVGLFRLRSIFSYGPQFKGLTFFSVMAGSKFPSLLASRQRLQINIGDGNLCDEAEYLRIGTTMLVLDAIEAGHPIPVPVLRRPMRALRQISADTLLATKVKTRDGRSLSALEIQRIYLRACRAFVARQTDPPAEVQDILSRWQAVLDDLETSQEKLIGRVDWITKRWLMEQCGADASWEVRKKIDLRYHELSANGYLEQLRSAGVVQTVLSDSEIESAMSAPPPDTPATKRGSHIRRFASQNYPVRANWQSVTVGAAPGGTVHYCAEKTPDKL